MAHTPCESRYEDRLLPSVDCFKAALCNGVSLESVLGGVCLTDVSTIDSGGSEIALDSAGKNVSESYGRMLDGQRLVEQE